MSHIVAEDITILDVEEEPWHAPPYLDQLKADAFNLAVAPP